MNQHSKILELITEINNSNAVMRDIFLHGSCFNFYHILKVVFDESKAYYSQEIGHVITKIGDKYYDITGEVTFENELYVPIGEIWSNDKPYNDESTYKNGNMYLSVHKHEYFRK